MKAVLLAAGLGTRLRPLTTYVPKCLAPIRGRPLLGYWLEALSGAGVEEIILNTHYLPEMVDCYLREAGWHERVRVSHEVELLGTGGTVLKHKGLLGGSDFMVAHADNLTCFDVDDFVERHRSRPRHCMLTMMTFRARDPRSCGVVELDDLGVVQAFHEKVADPPSNDANAAVYLVDPAVLELLSDMGKRNIDISTEVIPRLIGRIWTYPNCGYHEDIGTIESWRHAQDEYQCDHAVVPDAEPWERVLRSYPDAARTIEALL